MRAGWALATGRDPEHARALARVNDLLEPGRQARRVDEDVSAAAEVLAPSPLEAAVHETHWRSPERTPTTDTQCKLPTL